MAGRAKGGKGLGKGAVLELTKEERRQQKQKEKQMFQRSRNTIKSQTRERCLNFLVQCGLSPEQIKNIAIKLSPDHTNDIIKVDVYYMASLRLPFDWRQQFDFVKNTEPTIADILSHVVGNHSGSLTIQILCGQATYNLCEMSLDEKE